MAKAKIGQDNQHIIDVIIDSGSDITLISSLQLLLISPKPKIKTGQRVHLVQVTGKATISGYIEVPLTYVTPKGPVTIVVEAYVVK
ncbi:hypothetical protein FRC03_002928, partial [Tulasnella sp. 419]